MNKSKTFPVVAVATTLLAPAAALAAADASKGAVSWTKQMARAPHQTFTGKEYCREKWGIIMPQMATYGQLSFHEAQNIATFLGSASQPCGDGWFNQNVLLAGYGAITVQRDNDEGETTSRALYAQHIFVRPSQRTLFQGEFEFAKSLNPSEDVEFEGAEYLNLTYFAGDHTQVTVGKVLNDFNYSNLRLHPVWMNLAVTQPWAAGLVPSTTMGGKVGVHWEANGAILGGTVFGGSKSETRYLEADEMVGARFGAYLPASNLELGVSAAKADENDDKTVYGGYAIKKFTRTKLEGELAADSDRTTFWVGATVNPWQSGWLSRVSLVGRYQEFRVDTPVGHAEEEADGHDDGDAHVDALRLVRNEGHDEGANGVVEEPGHGEEGGGHHALLPDADAKEWYLGLVYDHPAMRSVHLRFQAGYVAGSGDAHDGWRAQAAFHW